MMNTPPKSIYPPQRLLMGPGPSNVHTRVLQAMSRPTIGHLDPVFGQMMEDIKSMLRLVFRTKNRLTIPLSAPGSVGMETCLVNLLSPGDTVIVCVNGVFGRRMEDIAHRCGAKPVVIETPWGRPIDVDVVERSILANPEASLLAFVHAETSTGVRSDAEELCGLASRYGLLTVVDAVTSLAGIPLETDAWGADAVYAGTQKCLSCPPGLSPLTLSPRAAERIKARTTPIQSWFMDLGMVMNYWDGSGGRTYHHTAPVNALYSLHEGLVILLEEGLEASWQRHAQMSHALWGGLTALRLQPLVDQHYMLPQLNAVLVPEGIDEAHVRKVLLEKHDIEIGAGLGQLAGKIWRIGLMGENARAMSVRRLIWALGETLAEQNDQYRANLAIDAAETILQNSEIERS